MLANVSFNTEAGEDYGIVKGRKRNHEGNFISIYYENPHLDTSVYEVEFEDGRVESDFANQIVDRMLSNIDDKGNTMYCIWEFLDHRNDGQALKGDNGQ